MTCRIAIDASSAVTGGGITYLQHLVPQLRTLPDLQIGPVLVRAEVAGIARIFDGLDVVAIAGRRSAATSQWKSAIGAHQPDVVYAPTDVSFTSYAQPLVLAIRNAALDMKALREYPARRRAKQRAHVYLARRSSRWAAGYVAVSNHARNLAPRLLRVPVEGVRVVYHGGPPVTGQARAAETRNFLFVSDLYRYKNLHRMLEALLEIDDPWSLDVVGRPVEADYMQDLSRVVARSRHSARVAFRGHLTGDELIHAYQRADCLLWPSYVETFGHPLVEAAAYGLPILAADAASNREVAGDAADYFPPFDVPKMRDLLLRTIGRPLVMGPLPRSYDWGTCAQETASFLAAKAEIGGGRASA